MTQLSHALRSPLHGFVKLSIPFPTVRRCASHAPWGTACRSACGSRAIERSALNAAQAAIQVSAGERTAQGVRRVTQGLWSSVSRLGNLRQVLGSKRLWVFDEATLDGAVGKYLFLAIVQQLGSAVRNDGRSRAWRSVAVGRRGVALDVQRIGGCRRVSMRHGHACSIWPRAASRSNPRELRRLPWRAAPNRGPSGRAGLARAGGGRKPCGPRRIPPVRRRQFGIARRARRSAPGRLVRPEPQYLRRGGGRHPRCADRTDMSIWLMRRSCIVPEH